MPNITAYAALGSAVSGSGAITELSGSGYTRQAVTVGLDPLSGSVTFTGNTFGPASGAWASAVIVGIFDAAASGNLLFSYPIPAVTVGSGGTTSTGRPSAQLTAAAVAMLAAGKVTGNVVLGQVSDVLGGRQVQVPLSSGPSGMTYLSGVLTATGAPGSLTYAATITPSAASTKSWYVTLTGNVTLNAPTGMVAGERYSIEFTQDATGSRTLTLGTGFKTLGGTPTLSTAANAVDRYDFLFDGTTAWGVLSKAFA